MFVNSLSLINAKPLLNLFILKKQKIIAISIMSTSIPFIILLITMIQYTSIEQQAIFDAISKIIPSSMNDMVVGIVREVYSKSIGTISISIIFTLWSAGKGLYALAKGLQSVYKTKGENRLDFIYLRLKSLVETIIFIFLIAVRINIISVWK